MKQSELKQLIKEELAKSNLKGNSNHNQFELLGRKISGRYSNRFDITKSEQFITIDVGGFNINIVSDASNDMVFVEMDSDNPKKSKEYGMRDYNKIFKVIDSWIKKHVNESVNETKKSDLKENLNPEVVQAVNKFIKAMAHRYGYEEQDAVNAIQTALSQRESGVAEGEELYTPNEMGDKAVENESNGPGY